MYTKLFWWFQLLWVPPPKRGHNFWYQMNLLHRWPTCRFVCQHVKTFSVCWGCLHKCTYVLELCAGIVYMYVFVPPLSSISIDNLVTNYVIKTDSYLHYKIRLFVLVFHRSESYNTRHLKGNRNIKITYVLNPGP